MMNLRPYIMDIIEIHNINNVDIGTALDMFVNNVKAARNVDKTNRDDKFFKDLNLQYQVDQMGFESGVKDLRDWNTTNAEVLIEEYTTKMAKAIVEDATREAIN